jgi:hypothetical protein
LECGQSRHTVRNQFRHRASAAIEAIIIGLELGGYIYEFHISPLSLAKMRSGANAFRISGYKLKPEDRMQQCYMPCGRRNNNSPATGSGSGKFAAAKQLARIVRAAELPGTCDGRQTCARYSVGVTPTKRRNTLVKWA